MSFLFVFIFLYSGIVRGVLTSDLNDDVPNYEHHDSDSKSTFSTHHTYLNGFGIANQYKEKSESETDEAHFDFELSFTSNSLLAFLPFRSDFSSINLNRVNFLQQPLYDLFCNWKFHLS